MHTCLSNFCLAGSLWCATHPAQGQATFSYGPKAGYTLATTHFENFSNSTTSYRSGLEVGLVGVLSYGHLALQTAALYGQKGYGQEILEAGDILAGTLYYNGSTRLDYLTIPINVAFTSHANGQGFQAFTGPYLGLLLGGRYKSSVFIDNSHYTGIPNLSTSTAPTYGSVTTGSHRGSGSNQTYSKGVDAGVQAGLGYRYGGWLLQAEYSVGLRNISEYEFAAGVGYYDIPYYNRAFQTSLSYLFEVKK